MVAALQRTAALVSVDATFEPSPHDVQRAEKILASTRPKKKSLLDRLVPRLIYDSLLEPLPGGVRARRPAVASAALRGGRLLHRPGVLSGAQHAPGPAARPGDQPSRSDLVSRHAADPVEIGQDHGSSRRLQRVSRVSDGVRAAAGTATRSPDRRRSRADRARFGEARQWRRGNDHIRPGQTAVQEASCQEARDLVSRSLGALARCPVSAEASTVRIPFRESCRTAATTILVLERRRRVSGTGTPPSGRALARAPREALPDEPLAAVTERTSKATVPSFCAFQASVERAVIDADIAFLHHGADPHPLQHLQALRSQWCHAGNLVEQRLAVAAGIRHTKTRSDAVRRRRGGIADKVAEAFKRGPGRCPRARNRLEREPTFVANLTRGEREDGAQACLEAAQRRPSLQTCARSSLTSAGVKKLGDAPARTASASRTRNVAAGDTAGGAGGGGGGMGRSPRSSASAWSALGRSCWACASNWSARS